MTVATHSQRETEDLARRFSAFLRAGDIVLLLGEMGAGKTAFVRGLAVGLGCGDVASSPTFALMNRYEGGALPLNHFDLYRLSSQEEAVDLDMIEEARGCVTAVEWPQVAGRWLADEARFTVTLDYDEAEDVRLITVRGLRKEEMDALSCG